ncbi:hypothetical protein [Lacticaseibacillus zeae]|uniref:Uncharacterized protein n=1 Tax=Lacticaseibacillus zeae subsp. silagei TaxID=3068307 RepID=A0ABD7Z9P6_LACZE|nr:MULTISPECIES: hypothetical protein [Lacticaseibacillus]MDE3316382.1 hypothetical protein [Lacticaseibacillus zeae]OFR90736.1 hypothetical protein HMPREF2861_13495 [Lactobacillus sp. HMSC068F07]WLV83905.1 hypothetical protein LACZS2_000298 [Lacticaseibacillus sp. NCIMB 15475]WLV86661.1 hypothetical protein LACZS1_000297 [Lacticaseibacillus sp. NCIMB 15474]
MESPKDTAIESIAFFPVTPENVAVINAYRYAHPQKKIFAVALKTTINILKNTDLGEMIKESHTGIALTNDLEGVLKRVDSLCLLQSGLTSYLLGYIKDIVTKADSNFKIFSLLSENFKESDSNLVEIRNVAELGSHEDYSKDNVEFYHTNAIVMAVASICEEFDNSRSVVYYAENFKKMGIKVAVLTTDSNCSILGYSLIPDECFNPGKSDTERVYTFNRLLAQLEKKLAPDLIIIDFPHSLLKYSELVPSDFGISSYIISQAIDEFDLAAITMTPEFLDGQVLPQLLKRIEFRFGFDVDQICCVNQVLEPMKVEELRILQTRSTSSKSLEEILKDFRVAQSVDNITTFDPFNIKNDSSAKDLLERLKKNSVFA